MSNEFGDPATDTHLDVRRIDIRPGRQDTTILRIVWAASVFRATSRSAEDGMDGSSFKWMSARATRAMSDLRRRPRTTRSAQKCVGFGLHLRRFGRRGKCESGSQTSRRTVYELVIHLNTRQAKTHTQPSISTARQRSEDTKYAETDSA